jgi:peptidoglycan/LPS O-acetylase OafA/YrhL
LSIAVWVGRNQDHVEQAEKHRPIGPVDTARHVPALDGIRGIAILMVTLYRFGVAEAGASSGSEGLVEFFEFGVRGVDLFFVLSGFLITGILLDAKDQPHFFRNFFARRSLRVFPLYFLVLFAALVVLPALSTSVAESMHFGGQQIWLWFYGTNLVQAASGSWSFGCLNHFWSLAVEEHFYLVWPFVIAATSRRTAIKICFGVILVAAVSRVAWLAAGGNGIAAEVCTLFRLDALAMGALLALLAREPGGLLKLRPWALLGLVAFGAALLVPAFLNRRLLSVPVTIIAAFFACLIIVAVTSPRSSFMQRACSGKFLGLFGKYSYGMYVFQCPLLLLAAPFVSVEALNTACGNVVLARLLYVALMTSATTLLAMASWHLIEKHFVALKCFFPAQERKARDTLVGFDGSLAKE